MCGKDEAHILVTLGQVLRAFYQYSKETFQQVDFKPWQAGILFIMEEEGNLSQRELAEKMNVTPASITNSIQKMEKAGYIMRCPDPKDQRVMRLYMTEKSKEYLTEAKKAGRQIEEQLLKGMSLEEKLLLNRLLIQMKENLS